MKDAMLVKLLAVLYVGTPIHLYPVTSGVSGVFFS